MPLPARPLVIAIAAVVVLALAARVWRRRRSADYLLDRLASVRSMRRLSHGQFIRACSVLFEHRGYSVSPTPPSRDGGVAITVRKDGQKGVVRCRHRRTECVKASEVRELLGAKQDSGADQAWLLTSGLVTHDAREFVRRKPGMQIWDAETIAALATRSLVEDATRETRVEVTRSCQEEAPGERICPECGEDLIQRDGRYGPFIGCARFPECRYTRDLTETEKTAHR